MSLTDKFFSLFRRDTLLFFSTLLTSIVIARKLGPEMMGIWTILLLIPGYSEAFGRLRFDISAVYFLGKKKVGVGEVTFILHLVAMLTSLLIITIFIIWFEWFYEQLFNKVGIDVRSLTYAVLSIIPLRLIYINYSYLLISQENIGSYNTLVILQALVTSFLSIGLILFVDMGIMGALIGNVIGLVIAVLYAGVKVQQLEKMNMNLNFNLLFKMAKYAVYQYINGLIGFFQNNLTNLITALLLIPTQVAFYALGKSICSIATRMVPTAVNTILFPRVSNSEDFLGSCMLVARSFRITLFILFVSTGLLVIMIKPVVYVLYGSDYYPIIVPFLIMISGVLLSQSASVFSSYFSGIGRSDLLPKISVFPFILQLVLALFLIPTQGVNGAAFSFSISAIILFVLQVYSFLKLSGLDFKNLIICRDDIRTVFDFTKSKLNLTFLKA